MRPWQQLLCQLPPKTLQPWLQHLLLLLKLLSKLSTIQFYPYVRLLQYLLLLLLS